MSEKEANMKAGDTLHTGKPDVILICEKLFFNCCNFFSFFLVSETNGAFSPDEHDFLLAKASTFTD